MSPPASRDGLGVHDVLVHVAGGRQHVAQRRGGFAEALAHRPALLEARARSRAAARAHSSLTRSRIAPLLGRLEREQVELAGARPPRRSAAASGRVCEHRVAQPVGDAAAEAAAVVHVVDEHVRQRHLQVVGAVHAQQARDAALDRHGGAPGDLLADLLGDLRWPPGGRRATTPGSRSSFERALIMHVPDDREGDHLAQRVAFGEDHHQAVDAHAAAGGGRVAVLDRARVLLVVGVGHVAVVDHAALALVDEALPLVDGVVELGVAADELDAADDRVEVLAQLGVDGVALGDRERLEREVEHVRGLVDRVLDFLGVDVGDDVRPGGVRVDRLVEQLRELLARGLHEVEAEALEDQLAHRHPPPRLGEVDLLAVAFDRRSARAPLGDVAEHLFGDGGHVVVVGSRRT